MSRPAGSRRSEFGRGYATCLRQFLYHENRLDEMVKEYARIRKQLVWPGVEKSYSTQRAIEVWMNGASDHLAGLTRPRRYVPVEEWRRARVLADRALEIGHGIGLRPPPKANLSEIHGLLDEARWLLSALHFRGMLCGNLDTAMVTDGVLGLRPDAGEYSCQSPLVERNSVHVPPRSPRMKHAGD